MRTKAVDTENQCQGVPFPRWYCFKGAGGEVGKRPAAMRETPSTTWP